MKIFLSFFLATMFALIIFPTKTAAKAFCACCAEQGHYSISTRKPDQYAFDELKKLKFQSAQLYTDAGYPDTIKGINPLGEKFTVNGSLAGNMWRFAFRDDKSKSGTLNLTKPVSMVEYMIDQSPATEGEPKGEVTLYKEWRFKYIVANGDGIFRTGIAPRTEYFLVLQGYGNVCTSADQFQSWRLEVSGTKADYAFFGKVASE
jgi:hypothetical protein